MNMHELVRKMDESFIELRKLHKSDEVDQVMRETVASLLDKIDQRDHLISELRLEIKQLKEKKL